MSLAVAVEGDTDLPIARKLARDAGLEIYLELDLAGKSQLDIHLTSYNDAAKGAPWFVLRDLDHDAACAKLLLDGYRFRPSRWMCFRVAVRALESWLLADADAVAEFFGVKKRNVPVDPDGEPNPTLSLVNLSRTSHKRTIREAMVPPEGFATPVGPLYEATIIRFSTGPWNLERACLRSPSLSKARLALRSLGARWRVTVEGTPITAD